MNLLVIAGSGIGGTEKAAFLLAEALVRRGHRVIALSEPDQTRVSAFEKAGGVVVSRSQTTAAFVDLIKSHQIQVIHQHVSGYGDHRQLYTALDLLGGNRPKLIETNVFGQLLDFHDRNHVDMRMFVSLTSGVQAFQRTRLISSPPQINNHTVLFNPLDPDDGSEEINRDSFRQSLGISPEDFVAIRVGRPGHKWARWECEAFRHARRKNPNLRLILMEPNQPIVGDVERGRYGEGIIICPATSDSRFLGGIYQSADIMMHASGFGESFGYTLAEAMVSGLPIVTRATPWGDNAQTELVSHNTTGYVCGSVYGMAVALLELSRNPEKCHEMGCAAQWRINSLVSLERETDLLEEILEFVMNGQPGPLMSERFKIWQEYHDFGYDKASKLRYELDHPLPLSFLAGRLYEKARCAKSLKRYFKLKFRGYKVLPPEPIF